MKKIEEKFEEEAERLVDTAAVAAFFLSFNFNCLVVW